MTRVSKENHPLTQQQRWGFSMLKRLSCRRGEKANFAAAGETEMRLFIVPTERRADRNLAIA